MRSFIPAGIIALAAALVVLRLTGALGDARAQLEAAQDSAAILARAATEATVRAGAAEMRADAADRRADSAMAVADSARSEWQWHVAQLAPVPPVAVPFTAPRDAIIAALRAENDALRSAVRERETETAELRSAIARLRSANAHLAESVRVLNEAIDDAQRSWEPGARVGVIGGMCTSGPCLGIGVSLGVRIPFL